MFRGPPCIHPVELNHHVREYLWLYSKHLKPANPRKYSGRIPHLSAISYGHLEGALGNSFGPFLSSFQGGKRGLHNITGHCCWLNSAVQCITHVPAFLRFWQDLPNTTVTSACVWFPDLEGQLWVQDFEAKQGHVRSSYPWHCLPTTLLRAPTLRGLLEQIQAHCRWRSPKTPPFTASKKAPGRRWISRCLNPPVSLSTVT